MTNQCKANTKNGARCKNNKKIGSDYCHIHKKQKNNKKSSDIEAEIVQNPGKGKQENEAIKCIKNASEIINKSSDEELDRILVEGYFDIFLSSIFDPESSVENVYSYFLKNKKRAEIIARIWYKLVNKYSYKLKLDSNSVRPPIYVSPYFAQWYNDGVMLTRGKAPFYGGEIILYQEGEIKYAVSARDALGGELLGPEDIKFVTDDELKKSWKDFKPSSFSSLEKAIIKLEKLLKGECNNESKYQSLLEENPWMFGATYNKISRHTPFNDENIPDFTGVRVTDNNRDIIEIKQPFVPIFKSDGKFRAEFHEALDQTYRYVDFATTDPDYLMRHKGLRFENPKGFLLIGYNLEEDEIKKIRRKERGINNITVYTYNDLLNSAKATLKRFKELKKNEKNQKDDKASL